MKLWFHFCHDRETLRTARNNFGDITSLLPILHEDSKSGFMPSLMVAKKYASILDGVSYVNPVIFDVAMCRTLMVP